MTDYINVFKGSTGSEEWSLTLHTQKAGGTLSAAAAAWAASAAVLWNGTGASDSIGQYCKSTTTLTVASTAELDPLTGRQLGRVETALALAGSGTGETLPPQVSVVASLRTALATRAGRGRCYLPPFTTASITAGRLATATRAVVAPAVQKWLQSLITATYIPCVYHRTAKTHDNIVTIDIGDVCDTQRRRRNKLIESRLSETL